MHENLMKRHLKVRIMLVAYQFWVLDGLGWAWSPLTSSRRGGRSSYFQNLAFTKWNHIILSPWTWDPELDPDQFFLHILDSHKGCICARNMIFYPILLFQNDIFFPQVKENFLFFLVFTTYFYFFKTTKKIYIFAPRTQKIYTSGSTSKLWGATDSDLAGRCNPRQDKTNQHQSRSVILKHREIKILLNNLCLDPFLK